MTPFIIRAMYDILKRYELAERYNETRRKIGMEVAAMLDMEEALRRKPGQPTQPMVLNPYKGYSTLHEVTTGLVLVPEVAPHAS